jgi:mono/diheme cytochrome c family protein
MRSLLFGLALNIAAAGAASAQGYAPPQGDAATGKMLFNTFGCYSCHGEDAQGTLRDGPRLNPPPAYPAVLQQLRTPRREMPPYVASVLPDKDVADIYAYLASLPKPPDPSTIPALQ